MRVSLIAVQAHDLPVRASSRQILNQRLKSGGPGSHRTNGRAERSAGEPVDGDYDKLPPIRAEIRVSMTGSKAEGSICKVRISLQVFYRRTTILVSAFRFADASRALSQSVRRTLFFRSVSAYFAMASEPYFCFASAGRFPPGSLV